MKKMTVAHSVLAILAVAATFAFSQTDTPSAAPKSNRQNAKHSTITGCLTSSTNDTYRLVDQNGQTNMVYSKTVHLGSYVGQSVTLVGDQSATPSTGTGTARPMPQFRVREVHPASGNCK
jgi:hypothetical protein